MVLVGTAEQIVDTLVQRREEWGVTNVVIGSDFFEDFAPIVAELAGS